ncbi:hypothetical protein DPMN_068392 [Dreissena polymorpha]|uniref:Uncharacterized protein n=1 Tax=Dreissena polymorpha TaxID=45954 RepID=A0A9D4BU67_DREPO|nr:hypothetical protein DPMN_068392 [Dreissena polymorpha]
MASHVTFATNGSIALAIERCFPTFSPPGSTFQSGPRKSGLFTDRLSERTPTQKFEGSRPQVLLLCVVPAGNRAGPTQRRIRPAGTDHRGFPHQDRGDVCLLNRLLLMMMMMMMIMLGYINLLPHDDDYHVTLMIIMMNIIIILMMNML